MGRLISRFLFRYYKGLVIYDDNKISTQGRIEFIFHRYFSRKDKLAGLSFYVQVNRDADVLWGLGVVVSLDDCFLVWDSANLKQILLS